MFFSFVWLFLLTVIFNLIPAFGPPTSLLLTYFYVQTGANVFLLTGITVAAAVIGRIILYFAVRYLGLKYLADHVHEGYALLRQIVHKNNFITMLSMMLYCVSPMPTNAIFIIAGAAKIKLWPLAIGFVIGRAIQYISIAVSIKAVYISFQDVLGGTFINPYSIMLSLLTIVIELLALFIDWENLILHKKLSFHKTILKKA